MTVSVVDTIGGTASCEETAHWIDRQPDDFYTTNERYYSSYSFTATPYTGWRFDHWERRSRSVADEYRPGDPNGEWDEYTDHRDSGWGNWRYYTNEREFTIEGVLLYENQLNTAGGYYIADFYYEYRAVFQQEGSEFTVTTAASPQNGGTETGGGRYSSGATCTITATPNSGYTFLRWELSNGETVKNATHSFEVICDITATAYFKQHSGKLLHGAGGTLIFGSAGKLLYDG